MTDPWLWWTTKEEGVRAAKIDYKSYNSEKYPLLTDAKINHQDFGTPTFRTESNSIKIIERHSIPTSSEILIDKTIISVITEYEKIENIEFIPCIIECKDKKIYDYFLFFTYNRVDCVDYEKSDIAEMTHYSEKPFIRSAYSFRYKPGCLSGFHIARERLNRTQLIVSDELKNAISRVDPYIEFLRPEDTSWPRCMKRV